MRCDAWKAIDSYRKKRTKIYDHTLITVLADRVSIYHVDSFALLVGLGEYKCPNLQAIHTGPSFLPSDATGPSR